MTDFVTLVYFRPIKEIYLIVLWKESLGRWSTLNVEVLFHSLRSSPHMLKSKCQNWIKKCKLNVSLAFSLLTPCAHILTSCLSLIPPCLSCDGQYSLELWDKEELFHINCLFGSISSQQVVLTMPEIRQKNWGFLTVVKGKLLSLGHRIVSEFDVWGWGSSVICNMYQILENFVILSPYLMS